MSWIEKVRKLPQPQKLKIIWAIVTITAILLIVIWVISARYNKSLKGDTTLFQTIGQGIHNIRENYRK